MHSMGFLCQRPLYMTGRFGSIGGDTTGNRRRRQRPVHEIHGARFARRLAPFRPLQHLDPAPDRLRGLGQRVSLGGGR
jgi:hypothetical protein